MTLQQLKYVATVESCGSFSKAAQKLYVSQPSISNLVHSLEAELGITIFIRSSTGISITDEGRELLRLGSKLLRDADYINEYFSSAEAESKPTFYLSSQHYDFVAQAFNDFVKDTKEKPVYFRHKPDPDRNHNRRRKKAKQQYGNIVFERHKPQKHGKNIKRQ